LTIQFPTDAPVLAVGLAYAIAFGVRIRQRLNTAAWGLGFFLPLVEVELLHLKASTSYSIFGLIFLSLVVAAATSWRELKVDALKNWAILLAVWLGWLKLSLVFSQNPGEGYFAHSRLFQLGLLALATAALAGRPALLRSALNGFVACLGLSCLAAIYQFLAGDFFFDIGRTTMPGYDYLILEPMGFYRAAGAFRDPNNLAAALSVAGLGLAWLKAHGDLDRRQSWLMVLLYLGFLATLSRSPWLGVLLAAPLALWGTSRRWQAVVLVAALLGLIWTTYARWDAPRPGKKTPYTSVTTRWVYWEQALAMVRERPLLGVGLKNYHPHFVERLGQESLRPLKVTRAEPHGFFIGLAAEGGLVGLVLFLGLAAWPWWLCLKRGDPLGLLAAGILVCVLVNAAFHNYIYQDLLWIALGLAAGRAFCGPAAEA